MTTITDWPAHTTEPTPVPLPRLGLCGDCPDEIRIRGNGLLYAHGCTGDGTLPLIALKPTFARWLWAQSRRRDDYTNLATLFAGRIYRPCTCSPKIFARDLDWTTPEQLHERLHLEQPGLNSCCSGTCRDLEKVADLYRQLANAA